MPETLKQDPSGKGTGFTKYRSSDCSIIEHPDESSGSWVIPLPKLITQQTFRPSSQLPPINLPHKYVAFQIQGTDQYLLDFWSQHQAYHRLNLVKKSIPRSRKGISKIRDFWGLRNNKEIPEEFLQLIQWLYRVDYKYDEPWKRLYLNQFAMDGTYVGQSRSILGLYIKWVVLQLVWDGTLQVIPWFVGLHVRPLSIVCLCVGVQSYLRRL